MTNSEALNIGFLDEAEEDLQQAILDHIAQGYRLAGGLGYMQGAIYHPDHWRYVRPCNSLEDHAEDLGPAVCAGTYYGHELGWFEAVSPIAVAVSQRIEEMEGSKWSISGFLDDVWNDEMTRRWGRLHDTYVPSMCSYPFICEFPGEVCNKCPYGGK